jgi:hypothetical protein
MAINVQYSPDLEVLGRFAQQAGYGEYRQKQQALALQQQQQATENSLRERQFQDNVARAQSQMWMQDRGQRDEIARAQSSAWQRQQQMDQGYELAMRQGFSQEQRAYADDMRQAQAQQFGQQMQYAQGYLGQEQQRMNEEFRRDQLAQQNTQFGQGQQQQWDIEQGRLSRYDQDRASAEERVRMQQGGANYRTELKFNVEEQQSLAKTDSDIAAVQRMIQNKQMSEQDGIKFIEGLEGQRGIIAQGAQRRVAQQNRLGITDPNKPPDYTQERRNRTDVDENGTWITGANGEPKLVINNQEMRMKQNQAINDTLTAMEKAWAVKEVGAAPTLEDAYKRWQEIDKLREAGSQKPEQPQTVMASKELQYISKMRGGTAAQRDAAENVLEWANQYAGIEMPPDVKKDFKGAVDLLRPRLTKEAERELDIIGGARRVPNLARESPPWKSEDLEGGQAPRTLGQAPGGGGPPPASELPMFQGMFGAGQQAGPPRLAERLPKNTPQWLVAEAQGLQYQLKQDWSKYTPEQIRGFLSEPLLAALPPDVLAEVRQRIKAAKAR